MGAEQAIAGRRLYGREGEFGVEGQLLDYIGVPLERSVCVERFLPGVSRVDEFLDTSERWYIDYGNFLEVAQPECQSLRELVAFDLLSQNRLVELATNVNDSEDPVGQVRINTRVVDSKGNSWGSHQNISMPYRTNPRDPQVYNVLATHLVTASVFTGVGEVVDTDPARRSYNYKVSQKMWRTGTVQSTDTTAKKKPIINTRDESHGQQRRLHITSADPTMTPWATPMSFGTT